MNENEFNPAQEETSVQPEAETPKKPDREKRSPAEIAIAVVAVVLIVAVLVALVMGGLGGSADTGATEGSTTVGTVPPDGNHDDVTCKGTYTVEEDRVKAEADKVVVTLGDLEMTNADLQIYYWMQVVSFLNEYGSYAPYVGLDYTQPLDTQLAYTEENWTWQQYFLYCGLDAWVGCNSLVQQAVASGFDQQSEDYQTYASQVREQVQASAVAYGFASIDEMLVDVVGPGSNEDSYIEYLKNSYLASLYYNALFEQLMPTSDEIETYFESNAEAYAENGLDKETGIYVDVRHILVKPEGGTTDESGVTTYSDEEWETARAEAQGLRDQWLAGDATEASFGDLANAHSDDGDGTTGGLYEDVYEDQMVPAFNDWCFDAARVTGDYGLVKTEYGYHVMYFVDSTPIWYATAEADLQTEIANSIIPDAMAKYDVTYDYTSMVLGNVDLG